MSSARKEQQSAGCDGAAMYVQQGVVVVRTSKIGRMNYKAILLLQEKQIGSDHKCVLKKLREVKPFDHKLTERKNDQEKALQNVAMGWHECITGYIDELETKEAFAINFLDAIDNFIFDYDTCKKPYFEMATQLAEKLVEEYKEKLQAARTKHATPLSDAKQSTVFGASGQESTGSAAASNNSNALIAGNDVVSSTHASFSFGSSNSS